MISSDCLIITLFFAFYYLCAETLSFQKSTKEVIRHRFILQIQRPFFRLAGRRPAMPVLKQGTRKKSVTTTTTYDGQKITPLIVGAQFSFWSFFIDFGLLYVKFLANSFKAYEHGYSYVTPSGIIVCV